MLRTKVFIISTAVILIFILMATVLLVFVVKEKNFDEPTRQIGLQEAMNMIKTDSDYDGLNKTLLKDFNPELFSNTKFGPDEYRLIKKEWAQKGLDSRIAEVDKVKLNSSTYWVDVVNKNDANKHLLAVLDVDKQKSLLLIASLYIEAGIGI